MNPKVYIPEGDIFGSGASNRVTFWTDADTLSYDDTFVWDNTTKYLGIGITPFARLSVSGTSSQNDMHVSIYGISNTLAPIYSLIRARAGSTAVQTGDALGAVIWDGHDGSDVSEPNASIQAVAAENFTGTNQGTNLYFFVNQIGSAGIGGTPVISIDQNQVLNLWDNQIVNVDGILGTANTDLEIYGGAGTGTNGGDLILASGQGTTGNENSGTIYIRSNLYAGAGNHGDIFFQYGTAATYWGKLQGSDQTIIWYKNTLFDSSTVTINSFSSAGFVKNSAVGLLTGGNSIDHNTDLQGLQGGTTNEYYHLTAAQYAALHDPVTVLDGTTIDFTLTGQQITGEVIQAALDHGSIGGLSDDDHTQYALLAGRSGGQTLIGGTAASNSLTLSSTSNITKGYLKLFDKTQIGGAPSASTYSFGDSLLNDPLYIYTTSANQGLKIEVQNAGAQGPLVDWWHNSSSPAQDDEVGRFRFIGNDLAGNQRIYGQMRANIESNSSTTPSGSMKFQLQDDGNLNVYMTLDARTGSKMVHTDFPMGQLNRDAFFISKRFTEGSGDDVIVHAADGLAGGSPDYNGGHAYLYGGDNAGSGTEGNTYIAYTEGSVARGDAFVGGDLTPLGRLLVPMGEISYFDMTGTSVTIVTQSDGSTNMVKAAPTTALTSGGMEFDNGGANDGRLRYTGTTTRMFHVACTITISPAGANDTFVFGVAKGGTVLATSKVLLQAINASQPRSTAMHVMVEMATNDYLELYVGNTTDADDCTVHSLNLFAMGM